MATRRGDILPVVLVLAVLLGGGAAGTAVAQVPETVALPAGCTNIILTYPTGTPLPTVAATVQPATALVGIFRYDPGFERFVAFFPGAPPAVNDYPAITAPLEAVFVCMESPGTIGRGGGGVLSSPAPAPALVALGGVSAPREVRRGESVTVILGVVPGHVCRGGVNIPTMESTFRFVPIEAVASSSGTVLIRLDVATGDGSGWAYFAVRCADGQVFRLDIRVL